MARGLDLLDSGKRKENRSAMFVPIFDLAANRRYVLHHDSGNSSVKRRVKATGMGLEMSQGIVAVILEYRGPSRTIPCVASLLASGVSSVLVLDNSDDGGISADTLRRALGEDARIRIESGGPNLGFAAGVNRALGMLCDEGWTGRVLLVNNDAQVLAGAVEALDRALDAHPRAAMAYPTIRHAGFALTLTYYHPWTGRLSQVYSAGGIPYVSGCCVLLERDQVKDGLFDETFFMYGEDVELSARLARAGRDVVHADDASVVHEGSASSGTSTLFYETHMVAAHVILAHRLADSAAKRAMYLAGRAVFLSLRAARRAIRHRSVTPLRGLVDGWRRGHSALRHRPRPGFSD